MLASFLNYYGFREDPFGLTPDPRFLYLTPSHREALAALVCGIETGRGFTTLIAQPGMGKTTLLFQLLEQYKSSARTAFLFQTRCDSRGFLSSLLSDLGVEPGQQSAAQMYDKFGEILLSEASKRLVVFIDEAHGLDERVLETVRLLSNFERPNAKLVQIVLAGQPALIGKLASPALHQRVSIRARLEPFTPDEAAHYIDYRLRVAGYAGGPLFTPEAQSLLAQRSEGIPRKINNLCFHALMAGAALSRKIIDVDVFSQAAADLGLWATGEEFESTPAKLPRLKFRQTAFWTSYFSRGGAESSGVIFDAPESAETGRWTPEAKPQSLQPKTNGLDHKIGKELEGTPYAVAVGTHERPQKHASLAPKGFSQKPSGPLGILEGDDLSWPTDELPASAAERLQKQVSELQTALEKQARETAERVSERSQASGITAIEELDKQLAAPTSAWVESFRKEAESISEECCKQLRQEISEMRRASVQALEAEHQEQKKQRELGLGPVDALRKAFSSTAQSNPLWAGHTRLVPALNATLRAAVWLLPVIPLLFVALSVRPVTHLQLEPPDEFVGDHHDGNTAIPAADERTARAYWQSALRDVQPKYGFGTNLPEEPPTEFRAGASVQGGKRQSDTATRRRYWQRLRQIWAQPQIWEKSFIWDSPWLDTILDSLERAGREIDESAHRL